MKRLFSIVLLITGVLSLSAQQVAVSGLVKDAQTGEPLIGANIVYGPTQGTVSDYSGHFSLRLAPGEYTLNISYVGYESEVRQITVENKPVLLTVELESMTIDEVIVTADMAISRETPVAFTNVNPAKIQEELAGQDLPMILNTTPGVYATQQGGGDGDARITIRGFDQRNLAVMIDGIPVNDMENGWVYWSNWFGLDLVTRTMQVQRGLGASQLALPSVGGTINILTKGIENKRQTTIKQSVDSQGKIQTNLGFTSGQLANGWGITLAGAYKRGDGWVDNTYSEGWFYYAKIDKRFKKHLLTFTAMGAPQMHDQRSFKRPISTYDTAYAKELGVNLEELRASNPAYNIYDAGITYNQHWGVLRRDKNDPDAPLERLSSASNQYHKPQFVLRDFWTISDRFTMSNNIYLSIGKGGGDNPQSSIKDTRLIHDPDDPYYGQINWQGIYYDNWKPQPPLNLRPTNPTYSDSLTYASNYMIRRHNEHYWVGLLSKFDYNLSESLDLSGGVDLRSYKGIHFTTVRDLLGGDYVIDKSDMRVNYAENVMEAMKLEGDTIDYYYDGLVRWGGIFGLVEYKNNRFTSFLNLSSAITSLNKVDYYLNSESGWLNRYGFTVKTGANYNLSERSNIYMNLGLLSKAKAYRDYYLGYTTEFKPDINNELVKAVELGYNYASSRFSANLNAYYTVWENKPLRTIYSTYTLREGDPGYVEGDPDQNAERRVFADITNMHARHIGVEMDFIYKIRYNLELQGTVSLGDWIYDSYIEDLQYYLYEGNFPPVQKVIDVDARGIHVGDAAQTQLGTSIRYEPFKGFYMNLRQTYFGKYYSNFSPEATLDESGQVHDSWIMPNFNLFDVHAGYGFRLPAMDQMRFNLRFSMLNVLDTKYLWDATNNDSYSPYSEFQDFDAQSATVFFGMGRRFTTSFTITF